MFVFKTQGESQYNQGKAQNTQRRKKIVALPACFVLKSIHQIYQNKGDKCFFLLYDLNAASCASFCKPACYISSQKTLGGAAKIVASLQACYNTSNISLNSAVNTLFFWLNSEGSSSAHNIKLFNSRGRRKNNILNACMFFI